MVNMNNLFLLIDSKGLTTSKISNDTGISTGNISDWKKGRSMPTANKLAILADYLDCSVDYLLGRSDNPTLNSGNSINQQYIGGDANAHIIGDNSSLVVPQKQESQDEMTTELIKAFNKLDFADKMEIMNAILDKTKK